ncbi:hypothetical protein [Flavobacterium pectinovorum]|uniref:NERD domain-containing protein n=1 Tax=Flavobacterium pectinovorum TaxID=29533 RepID=A0A502ENR1_9FLAO|nr:hypothetical protein [Flavobacterium pectinovorum]TPG38136.1 hypothetical protein EAH81_17025 [Flavobacterium pectinovorum]
MSFEELLAHFPDLEKDVCYKTLENSVYYLEEIKDSTVQLKTEEEYWNLCLENENLKEILFLENEYSIMKNEDSKKCDWVIFGNNNIHFIESKDVKPRNRRKERIDAIKQLIATIEFYKSKVDLDSITIFSQICFQSKSKTIKAGDQARKVLFKQYNSEFSEGNLIKFENPKPDRF